MCSCLLQSKLGGFFKVESKNIWECMFSLIVLRMVKNLASSLKTLVTEITINVK